MSTIHRVEPEPRKAKRTWRPAEVTKPGWMENSKLWTGELPPDIPPRPTGSRLRQRRWDALYGQNGGAEAVGSAQGSGRGENGCD